MFQEKVFLAEERLALQNQRSRELCAHCRRPTTVMLSPPPTPSYLDKVCACKFSYHKLFVGGYYVSKMHFFEVQCYTHPKEIKSLRQGYKFHR